MARHDTVIEYIKDGLVGPEDLLNYAHVSWTQHIQEHRGSGFLSQQRFGDDNYLEVAASPH